MALQSKVIHLRSVADDGDLYNVGALAHAIDNPVIAAAKAAEPV